MMESWSCYYRINKKMMILGLLENASMGANHVHAEVIV